MTWLAKGSVLPGMDCQVKRSGVCGWWWCKDVGSDLVASLNAPAFAMMTGDDKARVKF